MFWLSNVICFFLNNFHVINYLVSKLCYYEYIIINNIKNTFVYLLFPKSRIIESRFIIFSKFFFQLTIKCFSRNFLTIYISMKILVHLFSWNKAFKIGYWFPLIFLPTLRYKHIQELINTQEHTYIPYLHFYINSKSETPRVSGQ